MKAYEDLNCQCYVIEKEIKSIYPGSFWNNACKMWDRKSKELKNNNIKFEKISDNFHKCTCPTCGRMVCYQCV